MQLAQLVRRPVQLFCACDVFLVKAIQRATRLERVIELAQQIPMAITEMSARHLVVITPSVEKRSDCSQWVCDAAGNVIETHEHAGITSA